MAFGTLEIPVLLHARPVQRIAGLDVLARIKMEPAMPALRLRPRVPGDAQRLHAAARKLDQVLLQRPHPERVLDLVVGELAVRPVRVGEVLAVAARERRCGSRVGKFRVAEIAQDRFLVRNLHRKIVIGAFPRRVLFGMASRALRGAGVFRHGRGDGDRRRRAPPGALALRPEDDARDDRGRERHGPHDPCVTMPRQRPGIDHPIRRGAAGAGTPAMGLTVRAFAGVGARFPRLIAARPAGDRSVVSPHHYLGNMSCTCARICQFAPKSGLTTL